MDVIDIEQHADAVRGYVGSKFLDDPIMRARLSLWSEPAGRAGAKTLEAVWAPFDHIEHGARLAIVGITPGRYQAEIALSALRSALRRGMTLALALRIAKQEASFSGGLRVNLCRMLDHVGLPKWLGVSQTQNLWEPSCTSVHFTSALRHPVFYGGSDFNGQPGILSRRSLLRMVEGELAEEVRALPDAFWLPLWDVPGRALEHLVKRGVLRTDRLLPALPHPAGGNCENISHFIGTKVGPLSSLRARTGPLVLARRQELATFFGEQRA